MAAKKKTRPPRRRGRLPVPIDASSSSERLRRPPKDQVGSTDLDGDQRQLEAEVVVLDHRQDYLERPWTHYFESPGVEASRKTAGNPLQVWRAYLECRAHKLPIPDWVLSYLDRVARRFWDLSSADSPFVRADAPGQDLPDPATAIAEALEMKRPGRSGAGNVFSAYSRSEQAVLAIYAAREIELLNGKRKIAFARVAKARNISPSTVERAFNTFKDDLEADGVFKIKK